MCPRTPECSGPEPECPESEQIPQKSPGPGHTPTWFTLISVPGWWWHAALWWPHNIHRQQRKWSVGARGRELLAVSSSVIFSLIPIHCLLQKPTGTFTFQTDNFTSTASLSFIHEFLAFTHELHCEQIYLRRDEGWPESAFHPLWASYCYLSVNMPGQQVDIEFFLSPHFSCPLPPEVTDEQSEGPKWSQPRLQVDSITFSAPPAPQNQSRENKTAIRCTWFAFHTGMSCGGTGLTQVCKLAKAEKKTVTKESPTFMTSFIHNWGQLVWFSAQGVIDKDSNFWTLGSC